MHVTEATTKSAPTSRAAQDDAAGQRPLKVRWSLALAAAGALALAAGYLGGRRWAELELAAQPASEATATSAAPSLKSGSAQEPAPEPAQAESSLPDPERPPPANVQELVAEVREAMDHLLQVFPNSPDALEMKARSEQWRGRSAEAERLWQKCLELDANYIHAYVGMARTAADKGEHQRAADLAQRALEIDAGNFQARITRATALIHLRRPEDAVKALEDYMKIDPRSQGFYLLGQAYFDLKQFDKAKDALLAAIAKYSEYPEAHYLLSRAYRELGDEPAAKRYLELYRKLATPERMVLGNRPQGTTDLDKMLESATVLYSDAGRLALLRDRPRDAEALWRRAAFLQPKNVPVRQSLAFLCRNEGRPGETVMWFKELAEIEPSNASYWLEMGALFEEMNALPAAERALRTACEIAPENAATHAAFADLYVRYERRLPDAVTHAYRAVALQESGKHWALLSAAYLANGEKTAALTAISRALQLSPQSASFQAVFDSLKKDLESP
jgi:tetratricopeptide (TPR) repeat protein